MESTVLEQWGHAYSTHQGPGSLRGGDYSLVYPVPCSLDRLCAVPKRHQRTLLETALPHVVVAHMPVYLSLQGRLPSLFCVVPLNIGNHALALLDLLHTSPIHRAPFCEVALLFGRRMRLAILHACHLHPNPGPVDSSTVHASPCRTGVAWDG